MKDKLQELINLLLKEYQTKSGDDISFVVQDDSESNKSKYFDSPWKVTKIDAYVNGEHAGYLKISYIPREAFINKYPNIFSYLNQKGHSQYKAFDRKSPKEKLKILSFDLDPWPGLNSEEINNMSDDDIKAAIQKHINHLNKKYKKDFEKFEDFHVDKPLVDYIRVFDKHQRNRIGIALYEYGAKWLARQGMKLYASGIQSDDAKAAWAWLAKNKGAHVGIEKSPISKGETRTYLSYL